MTPVVAISAVVAYFLGAIPCGVLVGKSRGVDILAEGSGNPGATNVGRVLGKKWGTLVFLLDLAKGIGASLLGRWLLPEGALGMAPVITWFAVGLMAVLGHSRSPFIGFRGGKGVATAMGAGLGAVPVVALIAFGAFAVVLGTLNFMSVASVTGVWAAVAAGVLIPAYRPLLPLLVALALYVTWLHRKNFARIREGTEPRFRNRAKAAAVSEP